MALSLLFFNVSLDFTHFTLIWGYLQNRDAPADKRISKVVQAPGFIRGINPKSKIENPQAPAFIRGVNLKSKI
jgi:hypothetical protein